MVPDVVKQDLFAAPIFIVGCPRSGTTLMQSLLATQPGTVSFPETHFFELVEGAGGQVSPEDLRKSAASFQAELGVTWTPEALKDLVARAGEGRLGMREYFEILIMSLLERHRNGQSSGSSRLIEKTPYHVFNLDKISACFPGARFVFVLRDPLPTVWSYHTKLPGGKKLSLQNIAAIWRDAHTAYELFSKNSPERIMCVRYEDLVQDAELVTRGCCAFLGLKFEPERLQDRYEIQKGIALSQEKWKGDVPRAITTSTNAENVRKLSWQEILTIQAVAGQAMRRSGYPLRLRFLQSLYGARSRLRVTLRA